MHSAPSPLDDEDTGPSKTQRKKAMQDLQDLGVQLLELPRNVFDALDLDDRLREALETLRATDARGARKRQMQYVGKLMRHEDAETFEAALRDYRSGRRRDADAFHSIEDWRDRLLADDDAVNEWCTQFPDTDSAAFRSLVRNARNETARLMAGTTSKRPFYRQLFRTLRTVLQTTDESADD